MRRAAGLLIAVVALVATPAWADSVIIRCARPCTQVIDAVAQSGGRVTYRFRYVDAIAAEVPFVALGAVRAVAGAGAIRKDLLLDLPTTVRDPNGAVIGAEVAAEADAALDDSVIAALAGSNPENYRINNADLRLTALHAGNFLGQNT